jgi:anaerobic ribonucleoside-triphosphate reductase
MNWTIKSPREANRADGYPKDNKSFKEAAQKVLEDHKEAAEQALRFLEKLSEKFRAND